MYIYLYIYLKNLYIKKIYVHIKYIIKYNYFIYKNINKYIHRQDLQELLIDIIAKNTR